MPTKEDLQYYQAMPLDLKITFTMQRIREWVREFGSNFVYVSFSGGKDSTVLADLYAQFCKEWGCEMWLVFVNTGLEYPEIQKFVKWYAAYLQQKYGIVVHLEILRPQIRFDEVIRKYGYPIISKTVGDMISGAKNSISKGEYSLRLRLLGVEPWEYGGLKDSGEYDYEKAAKGSKFARQKYRRLLDVDFNTSATCCDVMKKAPALLYQEKTGKMPILATMAEESALRETSWLKHGCNAFDAKNPKSMPMSFWTEQDVLSYIKFFMQPKLDCVWTDANDRRRNVRKKARKELRRMNYRKSVIATVYGDIVYETYPEQMRLEEYGIAECGIEKLTTTGCERTGCIFCAFGCHREKEPSRFQRLKETHPRQYQYCIGGGEYVDGVWQPSKQGLGMGHVFDELNRIYGDGFIKY